MTLVNTFIILVFRFQTTCVIPYLNGITSFSIAYILLILLKKTHYHKLLFSSSTLSSFEEKYAIHLVHDFALTKTVNTISNKIIIVRIIFTFISLLFHSDNVKVTFVLLFLAKLGYIIIPVATLWNGEYALAILLLEIST